MKIADTISVNPGKTTLGHTESRESSLLRANVIDRSQKKPADVMGFLFPTASLGLGDVKKYALPLRILFATILIVSGISFVQTPGAIHALGAGVLEIVFGALLAFGLFTRPAMAGATIYFAVVAALSIRSGVADLSALTLTFGSAFFMLAGSGKYSADFLIRTLVKRARIKNRKNRKNNIMGYKAFHYAN